MKLEKEGKTEFSDTTGSNDTCIGLLVFSLHREGGLIHALLVIAIIAFVCNLISSRCTTV